LAAPPLLSYEASCRRTSRFTRRRPHYGFSSCYVSPAAAAVFRPSAFHPAGLASERKPFGERGTMVIPIPIGAKNVVTLQKAVWKFVSCAHCQQPYAYLLELKATGEDQDLLFLDGQGSKERARTQAERNLLQQTRNVVAPVPCPQCGCYQDDMLRLLKAEDRINWLQIIGAAITVLSFVPLVLGIPYLWVLTIVVAAAGLGVLTYGYVVAHRFDPNAGDPEPRKAIARRNAVWGEHLAKLIETNPDAAQQAAADQPRDAGSASHHIKPA
jgi:hypothetical protein